MSTGKRKKIIFWPDVYKEQGHWLPTLAWADYINSNGNLAGESFDIQYMGIADCEEIVKKFPTSDVADDKDHKIFPYSVIFANTYPSGYTDEVRTTPSSRWKPDHIWILAYAAFDKGERKKLNLSTEQHDDAETIRTIFDSYKPDLLVSGYFTALETLIIHYNALHSNHFPKELKFAISTTYLRHPEEDLKSRALQNLMAFTPEEWRKLINMVYHHRCDNLLEDPGISLEEFVEPLGEIPEFIPCPRSLDYSHYVHSTRVHYGEPCITKELEIAADDSGDLNWDEILQKEKLIYVTAGSQVLDYTESALSLFLSMISAMQSADMKDFHLILCVGSTLIQNSWDEYENVTVCGWAPQRKILEAMAQKGERSCCAVIHGGLATIKECIYFGVPFLVLPLGKDQMDNALRLEDKGIQNRFYVEYAKPKCLRYFINQVLQDYVSLKNLKKLSAEFKALENLHATAKEIAELA